MLSRRAISPRAVLLHSCADTKVRESTRNKTAKLKKQSSVIAIKLLYMDYIQNEQASEHFLLSYLTKY